MHSLVCNWTLIDRVPWLITGRARIKTWSLFFLPLCAAGVSLLTTFFKGARVESPMLYFENTHWEWNVCIIMSFPLPTFPHPPSPLPGLDLDTVGTSQTAKRWQPRGNFLLYLTTGSELIKTFVSLKVKLTLVNREGFTLKWFPLLTCMWTNAELGTQRSENHSPATSHLGLLIKPFFPWASTAPAPLAASPLCPGPNTLPLKPLKFWNDEGLTYANELTGGWVPLDSLRTGCGHQKDQGKIRELQLSAPPGPQCPGGVEGLEAEFSTRGQWFNQSFLRNEPLLLHCIVQSLSCLWPH